MSTRKDDFVMSKKWLFEYAFNYLSLKKNNVSQRETACRRTTTV